MAAKLPGYQAALKEYLIPYGLKGKTQKSLTFIVIMNLLCTN